MLLSFVAHADGYKIMIGAYNTVDITVECQMHVGALLGMCTSMMLFFRY